MDITSQRQRPELRLEVPPGHETEWPGASALATECVLNVALLADALARCGDDLCAAHGIPSRAGFNVLTILDGAGERLAPSVLAERMIVSRPTVTKVVASLERRGQVRRTDHPHDGRSQLIAITPKGRRSMTAARTQLHQLERRIVAVLDSDEQRSLLAMVAALRASVEDHARPVDG